MRVHATGYAGALGPLDRMVYNSINYTLSEGEIAAIKETGDKTAIVQAFNPSDPRPRGMVDAIVAYNARTYGVKLLTKAHPLYRFL